MESIRDILKTARRFTEKGDKLGKSLKGKELGSGITQRKNGLYQGAVMKDGKRVTLYSRSLTDLKKKMTEPKAQRQRPMTLDTWYETWITVSKSHLRDSSKRVYGEAYIRVKPYLGSMDICDVTKLDVERAISAIKTESSKKYTLSLITDLFQSAVDNGLIQRNPAIGIRVSHAEEKKEKRVLTKEEADLILTELEGTSYLKDVTTVMLYTGMRIGEVLALKWENVDFNKRRIYVGETLIYLPGEGFVLHPPKTSSGRRSIPMIGTVADVLEKRQKTSLSKFIFVTRNGSPINDNSIRQLFRLHFRKIEKRNPGVNFDGVTPHSFRHTFATNAIANGMQPKVLQKILGHASLKMTMDLYCHIFEDTLDEEMAKCFENAV